MTTIVIPASVEEATERLVGIEGLLTAKEWERAAVVAAFVEPEPSNGRPKVTNSSHFLNVSQFADLGITGLRSKDTVRRYVKAWESTGKDRPKPGEAVVLPTDAFPKVSKVDDATPGAQKVKDIQNNVSATAKALADKSFAAKVAAQMPDETKAGVAAEVLSDPEVAIAAVKAQGHFVVRSDEVDGSDVVREVQRRKKEKQASDQEYQDQLEGPRLLVYLDMWLERAKNDSDAYEELRRASDYLVTELMVIAVGVKNVV